MTDNRSLNGLAAMLHEMSQEVHNSRTGTITVGRRQMDEIVSRLDTAIRKDAVVGTDVCASPASKFERSLHDSFEDSLNRVFDECVARGEPDQQTTPVCLHSAKDANKLHESNSTDPAHTGKCQDHIPHNSSGYSEQKCCLDLTKAKPAPKVPYEPDDQMKALFQSEISVVDEKALRASYDVLADVVAYGQHRASIRAYEDARQPEPVSGLDKLDAGLDMMSKTFAHWIEFNQERGGNDMSHVITPPTWPIIATLKAWIVTLERAREAMKWK